MLKDPTSRRELPTKIEVLECVQAGEQCVSDRNRNETPRGVMKGHRSQALPRRHSGLRRAGGHSNQRKTVSRLAIVSDSCFELGSSPGS